VKALKTELDIAIEAAMEAGEMLSRRYGKSKVHYKADRSIVTEADLESERRIRSIL